MALEYEVVSGVAMPGNLETRGVFQGLQRAINAWNAATQSWMHNDQVGRLIENGELGTDEYELAQMALDDDAPESLDELAAGAREFAEAIAGPVGHVVDFRPSSTYLNPGKPADEPKKRPWGKYLLVGGLVVGGGYLAYRAYRAHKARELPAAQPALAGGGLLGEGDMLPAAYEAF